jgi:hypothetical protein
MEMFYWEGAVLTLLYLVSSLRRKLLSRIVYL